MSSELRVASSEFRARPPRRVINSLLTPHMCSELRVASCRLKNPHRGLPLNSLLAILNSLLFTAALAAAQNSPSVVNSPHDLSAMGPGRVRAVDETEVCIFCHTPHHASPHAPLWNRHNPTAHYRIYRSPTLQARIDQPGPASKLCLSCHDGTIALGLTLNRPMTMPIPMTYTYMPTGPSDLTTDLSDDHPIGFRCDRALSVADRQVRQPELVDHRLRLGEWGEVECTTCHDPHNNTLGNFLRITDREGALCTACHRMFGWQTSIHALSPRSVPASVTDGQQLAYRSMSDNACRSCHDSHSAQWRPRLLYDRPSRLCLDCHDGLTAQSVLPVIDQRFGHRFNVSLRPDWAEAQALSGPTGLFGASGGAGFSGQGGLAGLARRQCVECTDCHNPHAVAKDIFDNTPLDLSNQGPLIPPAMVGVPGVTIAGVPVERASAYYEVCFRCHSDFPVIVQGRIIRAVPTLGNIRREFQPTAASAHPVAFPARDIAEVPSLLPEFRTRPFISCQSCHNNPGAAEGGFDISGPHTSPYQFLLAARYETADFSTESPQTYALCYRCHDRNSILGDESFALHNVHVTRGRSPCSACHAPHGVPGSPAEHDHLINFDISIVSGRRQYLDTGLFSGTCTLTCHGVQHVNFTYAR